ncbi:type II toxin-antitoxin system RelE/ParE family toxin [Timonella sp. A28]|uniref:type II toxin-antitoxin system RelE/ParE family toxin n=1 Tax=Timonella sp. A28 TaxID=3442640 RepID=UPI003EB7801B
MGRPIADRIKTSRHHNMKELRPPSSSIRVLFAFDPEKRAILLIAGDKSGNWKKWYSQNIPLADDLYDKHLNN